MNWTTGGSRFSLAVATLVLVAPTALGQSRALGDDVLMLGIGAIPGLGIQAGYVAPRTLYTREALLYVDAKPFSGKEGSVQIAVVIGGSARIIGIAETLGAVGQRRFDLDFGLRLGPGLTFQFEQTRSSKNQRFSLAFEPFLRFSSVLGPRRHYYVEAGVIRPLIRAGVLLRL